jgi:hypothetical protein
MSAWFTAQKPLTQLLHAASLALETGPSSERQFISLRMPSLGARLAQRGKCAQTSRIADSE